MVGKHNLTAPPYAALEAAIDARPDDPEAYWIYGDWLESQGDPRGRCIATARALMQAPEKGRRQVALAQKRVTQAMAELRLTLGPLGRFHERLVSEHDVRFRFGMMERARIRRRSKTATLVRELETLLSHPSSRFLRHLTMSFPDLRADRPGFHSALERLAELAPYTLTSLALQNGGQGPGEIGDALARLPQVTSLWLDGDDVRLAPPSTQRLRSLTIGTIRTRDPWLLDHGSFGALEQLELVYFNAAADIPRLVFSQQRFPCLTELRVWLHRGWSVDSLMQLFDPGLLQRLRRLDLAVPWFNETHGAWLLEQIELMGQLARLRVDPQKEKVSAELAERLRRIPGFELDFLMPRDPYYDSLG